MVTGCLYAKEDIVEKMDGRREREPYCRVSGLLDEGVQATANSLRSSLAPAISGT